MKQQNFLFVDIISSFCLILILIGNFMGLLYITEGNIALSLLGSLVLVVCYYFAVDQLKNNKEAMCRNNFLHKSMIIWLFFLVLSYVSFNLMAHFINVEYNCKNQIKAEATAKLNLVDSIAEVYKNRSKKDIETFDATLKTKLLIYKNTNSNALRNELAGAPYNVTASVLNNPAFINVNEVANAKVTPYATKINANIKNIQKTINDARPKYQSVFDNWKRFSLVETYAKLNQYVDYNATLINSKIAELPLDKNQIPKPDFQKQLPLNSPSELTILYKPNYWIPIIFIILTHLFLLIPFFTHKIKGYTGNSKEIDPLEIENVREI